MSTLTPNHSREFYPQVSRFLHSKVKLSRITLQSSILTLIRKSKISIPILQSFILKKKRVFSPRKLFNFNVPSIFQIFGRHALYLILSYLILMWLRLSRETSATLPTHACVHFFPKLFPSLTEQRGSCLKLNSGIGLVKYLALTQLGNKAAISTGFEPVETFAGNRKFKIKKAKATALDPPLFSFSSSFFVLFSLEIAFRFGFYRIFDGGGNRGEFRHV